MHGKCGEMAKQGCCPVVGRNDPSQLPTHVVAAPVLPLAAIAYLYPLLIELPASAGHPWQLPNQNSLRDC